MNALRRKSIAKLQEKIEELRSELEQIMEEEEEYRDNMPDNLQGSERYWKADEACDNLESAVMSLEEALEHMEGATA